MSKNLERQASRLASTSLAYSHQAVMLGAVASSIETVQEIPEKPETRVITVPAPEEQVSGRFSEEPGESLEQPNSERAPAGRVLLDGSTDQGFRPAPKDKPARRDLGNKTDTREWRREYQKEYRQDNP